MHLASHFFIFIFLNSKLQEVENFLEIAEEFEFQGSFPTMEKKYFRKQ